MMSWQKFRRFMAWLAAATVVTLVGMVLLPHDEALAWRSLTDGNAPTAYWIYRRIHDDPTPIDVAFIGTSRTGMSMHSERMEHDLAERGVQAHIVNFHVVRDGSNMGYAVAKELLTYRRPRLLVIELTDFEARKPHPDFIYIASVHDVLAAPLFINFNYLSDLARLPGRQAGLFVDTLLERAGWGGAALAPIPYIGAHLDHSEYIDALDGIRHPHDTVNSPGEMDRMRVAQDQMLTRRMLPASMEWLEYRVPRYYLDAVVKLAADKGVRVAFVYLPSYKASQQSAVYERSFAKDGPLINPSPVVADRTDVWADAEHMNWAGAQLVTDEVARQIAEQGLLE